MSKERKRKGEGEKGEDRKGEVVRMGEKKVDDERWKRGAEERGKRKPHHSHVADQTADALR